MPIHTVQMQRQRLLILVIFSLVFLHPQCSNSQHLRGTTPPFLLSETQWADSVLAQMSLDEKIGQLFMVAAYSNKDSKHVYEIDSLIQNYHIGGLIFMQGGPVRQANLNNHYQTISKVPLLIGMDAEWGLSMRLDSTILFPRQMTLGATFDDDLIYAFGREQAWQLKRMGVHVSFSPVIDVNNNAANPVISNRAFSEDRELVTRLGEAYMKGLQDGGVLATGKHFPGHGDTKSDSHKTLPRIEHSLSRLDSLEFYPFKHLINSGLSAMMVAHLNIPALDTTPDLPSTLSKNIVTGLLREQMGFNGLIFTDALNMKGVANYSTPGEVDFMALKAGNDILLFPENVPNAVTRIKAAIADSTLTEEEIDGHCLRILKSKFWCGLAENKFVETDNLIEDLQHPQAQALNRELIESSITVLENDNVLPLMLQPDQSIAVLTFGSESETFKRSFSRFADADYFTLSKNPDFNVSKEMEDSLSKYNLVVVNLLGASNRPSTNFGASNQSVRIINAINSKTKVVVNVFTNPYALKNMRGIDKSDALLIIYQDDTLSQWITAEVLVGASKAQGRLPITPSDQYVMGNGNSIDMPVRLRTVLPESAGFVTEDFAQIDSIALKGIREMAYPGCRIVVAKGGDIIVDRSYGKLTYEGDEPVTSNTVYDLASITKIVSSTAALMHLQDQGEIDLDYNLCDYLELSDTSKCYNMNLREMMSHYAQLPAWIPFYEETISKGKPNPKFYRTAAEPGYTTQVAENLYIRNAYRDTIFNKIAGLSLRADKEYKYSDLGYYFIQQIIERKTKMTLDAYVDSVFYRPMGLRSMGYHPLRRMDALTIAPTEQDKTFRNQLVRGYVHDPGAAMMGGVGGHAGVFANAYDLAAMMQMFLNEGSYGGQQYLSPATLKEYTSCQYCEEGNRRGAGFDKPTGGKGGPTCPSASKFSYGHTGFTGTMVWADPSEQLVYVFLSNRVYPDAENKKLLNMNIRTDIQQVIYDAIRAARTRKNQEFLGDIGK